MVHYHYLSLKISITIFWALSLVLLLEVCKSCLSFEDSLEEGRFFGRSNLKVLLSFVKKIQQTLFLMELQTSMSKFESGTKNSVSSTMKLLAASSMDLCFCDVIWRQANGEARCYDTTLKINGKSLFLDSVLNLLVSRNPSFLIEQFGDIYNLPVNT